MTALRPELPVGAAAFRPAPLVPAPPPPCSPMPSSAPSVPLPASRSAPSVPLRTSSPPVPLRRVPSRRFPGPSPAADDLVHPGDPVVGRLIVDSSRSVLSPHLRGRSLAISVDGVRRGSSWGRTVIELPPGRHLVQIEVEQAGHRAIASEVVPVAAGSVVEVFYRAPALPWTAGAIGPSRPRPRGRVTAGSSR